MENYSDHYQKGQLILKYLKNELSIEENQELEQWLEQDQANLDLFKRLTDEITVRDALHTYHMTDKEADWVSVLNKLNQQKSIKIRLWSRIAAAAVLILVVSACIWTYNNGYFGPQSSEFINDIAPAKNSATLTFTDGKMIQLDKAKTGIVVQDGALTYADGTKIIHPLENTGIEKTSNPMVTAATPRAGTYTFTLQDGTKVWLNAGSALQFPVSFVNQQRRKVILKGEAYFEVAKLKKGKAAQPFIVISKNQEVEVLGTHFNIDAYADGKDVTTTLLEGSVKIVSSENKTVILKPGQRAVLKNKKLDLTDVDINEAVAWKNGNFIFNGRDIESIMRELEKWYDIEVTYQGKITDERYYGDISRSKNLISILKMLEKAQGVHFKVEGRRVKVML